MVDPPIFTSLDVQTPHPDQEQDHAKASIDRKHRDEECLLGDPSHEPHGHPEHHEQHGRDADGHPENETHEIALGIDHARPAKIDVAFLHISIEERRRVDFFQPTRKSTTRLPKKSHLARISAQSGALTKSEPLR